jgi:CheY-like chemotaxis protein
MDLHMPIMSGYEASKKIIENSKKEVPIIALSADVFLDVKEKVKEFGMKEYVSKPIDFDILFEKMDKYLNLKTQINNEISNSLEVQLMNQIVSFNVNEGIARIGGDTTIYINTLKKFAETSKNVMLEIQKAKKHNRIDIMLEKLHQFKGIAGNLGLLEGYNLAINIETELKKENYDVLEKIDFLEKIVDKAILEIENIDIDINPNLNKKNISTNLENFLEDIKEKLESYDVDAIEIMINSEELFLQNGLEDYYNNVLKLINNYNYELALDQIKQLMSDIL